MGRGNNHRDRRRQFGDQPSDPWGDYAPPPSLFERPSRPQTARAASDRETEAQVKWFNPEKGFGFVDLTDGSGEAFLHVRQVEAAGHNPIRRPVPGHDHEMTDDLQPNSARTWCLRRPAAR